MSRIDQALRRAASTGPFTSPDIPATVVPEKPEASLDTYPTETAAAIAPQRPVAATIPFERPTLARHPSALTIERRLAGSPLEGKLIGTRSMDAAAGSQYEALASALRIMQGPRALRSVMVSSALAKEGKTLTAVNLALVLSERFSARVLLIDADFQSPSLHDIFQVPNVSGLGDALAANNGNIPVMALSTNLALLTAGRLQADSMSALLSPQMKALLSEAASSFDWIVLDTPSITQLADPQLLAWLADGVVLVVDANHALTKVIRQAISELGSDRVLGVVLNRAK